MTSANVDSLDDSELTSLLKLLEAEQTRAHLLMNVVIPIGVALAQEQDLDRLLERIVQDAMDLSGADRGTLHLVDSDEQLRPAIVRDRHPSAGRCDGVRMLQSSNVAIDASRSGALINLPQIHPSATSHGARSCLAMPLRGAKGAVIGVVELADARGEDGEICPFEPGIQEMVESLGKLASVALDSYLQQQKLKEQVRELSIQIDESKKHQQVSAITETSYFKSLQSRARALRAENEHAFRT